MNDVRDIAPLKQHELQQGVTTLHARRNKMRLLTMSSATLMVLGGFALFFNQSLVYSYFDLSTVVQQLHIPMSAGQLQQYLGQQPDYFGRLLTWVLWSASKVAIALVGATLFVIYAQKINFFKVRMHNFGKRFLAWIIAFMLLIGGISAVQNDVMDDEHQAEEYAELVEYRSNIQDSELYTLTQQSQLPATVEAYLLAQTALLHDPVDQDVALAYVTKLVEAERDDAKFLSYGFKPQQIWAMQQQIYGKAVTPFAESVHKNQQVADKIVSYSQVLWLIIVASFAVLAFIFYGLMQQFNRRIGRIEQGLQ